jgi:hypothetical protein
MVRVVRMGGWRRLPSRGNEEEEKKKKRRREDVYLLKPVSR